MIGPYEQIPIGNVRAVLGHVEPTSDWTLRSTETGQLLGRDVVKALSSNLFSGQPLGLAFDDYLRLTAIDRQSMVLLGDPTVALPALV